MKLVEQVDRFMHRISPYLDCGIWGDPNEARQRLGEYYVFFLKLAGKVESLRGSNRQWIREAADAWHMFRESDLTKVAAELSSDSNYLVRVLAKLYLAEERGYDQECKQFVCLAVLSTSPHHRFN